MGIPAVKLKKSTVGGSPALQTNDGILAIMASASTGTALPPTMLTNQSLATTNFGNGFLPEAAVYDIEVSGNPVVALAQSCSVAGSYGAITKTIAGSGTVVAGATQPLLHYNVQVTVVNGFTVGVAGGTVTWTVDGGDVVNGPLAVGTGSTLTLPGTGVSFAIGLVFAAGDTWQCFTERPMMNNADLAAGLATLGMTNLPWEGVLLDAQYGTGTVSLVDTWLRGREANGQFNFALLNTRFLLEPCPTGEAPSVYAAAMIAQTGGDSSGPHLREGADGGRLTSLLTGFTTKFPTSLALAAMAMSLTPSIGVDPAYVGNGPVEGFQISSNGNPLDWDEFLYQSLDSQRLTTLRTFASGGPTGVFITDANVLMTSGSNIYWLQLLRVLNKGCRIAWQILNTQLSRGVRTVFNANTQAENIDPRDAQTIEALVNVPLASGLAGQVTASNFAINRDDDLSEPKAPCNSAVSIATLVYLKNIVVTAALVKSISVPRTGA